MDKVTPKDVFQANRDRAAPLLAKLKSEGIGHMIDGKTVPSTSGQTFETKSPVDGAVLASVARGNAEDIDRANPSAILPIIGRTVPIPDGAIPVWLSEPATWLYPYRAGDTMELPIAGANGTARVFVAGIWRDYGRQQGTIAMDGVVNLNSRRPGSEQVHEFLNNPSTLFLKNHRLIRC